MLKKSNIVHVPLDLLIFASLEKSANIIIEVDLIIYPDLKIQNYWSDPYYLSKFWDLKKSYIFFFL